MSELHALNRKALDPARSVVVEACAGSGKTWLLVSRIVRLLLAGVPPGDILAITFTRKAAQEMAARLRQWLFELATLDDDKVREMLLTREVPPGELVELLPRARALYERVLVAEPGVTITTFHSWFMQ
ncbi:MAG TPA: UvrD-helicase domain-containing protein, partial [Burkholderiales bacterium]|nr:UvrD-helicase domain-containing protein [Burkholderiales bacterium]